MKKKDDTEKKNLILTSRIKELDESIERLKSELQKTKAEKEAYSLNLFDLE